MELIEKWIDMWNASLVKVIFWICNITCKFHAAVAGVAIHFIDARASVPARTARTLFYVLLAVHAGPSGCTCASVACRIRGACSTKVARLVGAVIYGLLTKRPSVSVLTEAGVITNLVETGGIVLAERSSKQAFVYVIAAVGSCGNKQCLGCQKILQSLDRIRLRKTLRLHSVLLGIWGWYLIDNPTFDIPRDWTTEPRLLQSPFLACSFIFGLWKPGFQCIDAHVFTPPNLCCNPAFFV